MDMLLPSHIYSSLVSGLQHIHPQYSVTHQVLECDWTILWVNYLDNWVLFCLHWNMIPYHCCLQKNQFEWMHSSTSFLFIEIKIFILKKTWSFKISCDQISPFQKVLRIKSFLPANGCAKNEYISSVWYHFT